jgi:hypothetical protein
MMARPLIRLNGRSIAKPKAAAMVILLTMSAAASGNAPSVIAQTFRNVEEDAVWWTLEEIADVGGEPWLLGRTNYTDASGSLLYREAEIVLRAADLAVTDHPLEPSIHIGVDELRRGWGLLRSGDVVLHGALRCDDCTLAGEEAALRWNVATGDAHYLFSSADEMRLGDEITTISGIEDVHATRAGDVYAALRIVGGLSSQYGLIRAASAAPPDHVQGVLLPGAEIRTADGEVVGAFDDLFIPGDGRVFDVLPFSGELLVRARVEEPGGGTTRHILRDGVSVRRPGQFLAGVPLADLSGAVLGEKGELFFAGRFVQGDDITFDNDGFIAWGDALAVREGEACPGLPGFTFAGGPAHLAANHHGDAAFAWSARDADGETLDVLYYNGELLLKSGDRIDVNGDGVIDDDDHGSVVAALPSRGDLLLGRTAAHLFVEAVLPQYGLREVLLRVPLPVNVDNPWDTRPPCPGDVDGDRLVDQADLGLLLAAFEHDETSPAYDPRADFDADGDVDQADLGELTAAMAANCD